jgi:hypothetical protein
MTTTMTPQQLVEACMAALSPVLEKIKDPPAIGLLSWARVASGLEVAASAAAAVSDGPVREIANKTHADFVSACQSFVRKQARPHGDILYWIAEQGLHAMRPYLPPEISFASCVLGQSDSGHDVGVFMFSMSDEELQMGPVYHLDKARRFMVALQARIKELEGQVSAGRMPH